jgi:serine/threonine protein kinase
MKLVRGHRLDEIAPRLTDIAAALRIVLRICEAVGFAHAHGVIHRDLKPENIMVGEFGEVLVLDWGVAKVREATASAHATMLTSEGQARGEGDTAFGTRIGTPAYMAPEQASGDVDRMDERTDVFGIGAILAVLLLQGPWVNGDGKPPAAESLPRALDQARPALPRPLRSIARRALAPSPAERYDSVTSLADDLTRFLDARSVSAHPEGPFERAGRFVSRYRFVVALVVTYMVLRILLIIFTS